MAHEPWHIEPVNKDEQHTPNDGHDHGNETPTETATPSTTDSPADQPLSVPDKVREALLGNKEGKGGILNALSKMDTGSQGPEIAPMDTPQNGDALSNYVLNYQKSKMKDPMGSGFMQNLFG